MVVVDEAHAYRSSTTQRAEVLNRLLEGSPPKALVLLTATPVNNSLWDLYNLLAYFVRNDADVRVSRHPFAREKIQGGADDRSGRSGPGPSLRRAVAGRRPAHPLIREALLPRGRDLTMGGVTQRICVPTPEVGRSTTSSPRCCRASSTVSPHALEVPDDGDGEARRRARVHRTGAQAGEDALTLARYAPSAYRLDGEGSRPTKVRSLGCCAPDLLKRFESSAHAFAQHLRAHGGARTTTSLVFSTDGWSRPERHCASCRRPTAMTSMHSSTSTATLASGAGVSEYDSNGSAPTSKPTETCCSAGRPKPGRHAQTTTRSSPLVGGARDDPRRRRRRVGETVHRTGPAEGDRLLVLRRHRRWVRGVPRRRCCRRPSLWRRTWIASSRSPAPTATTTSSGACSASHPSPPRPRLAHEDATTSYHHRRARRGRQPPAGPPHHQLRPAVEPDAPRPAARPHRPHRLTAQPSVDALLHARPGARRAPRSRGAAPPQDQAGCPVDRNRGDDHPRFARCRTAPTPRPGAIEEIRRGQTGFLDETASRHEVLRSTASNSGKASRTRCSRTRSSSSRGGRVPARP